MTGEGRQTQRRSGQQGMMPTGDVVVAAAYGWPADISDEDTLAALIELNQKR
ncbi:hypothetical protein [Candidatus Poriferisodalis sp.]|uniref:hypothetical protein n=1 Tax=Candidatus Poriferisodalis sp. TaxID=3101277 RepID=UPI003B51E97F